MVSDGDLLKIFIEETRENLQSLEEGIIDLETNPHDQELIDVVFRAMHSIKGGAGLVGADVFADLSHELENILDNIRQEGYAPENVFTLLFAAIDLFNQILAAEDFQGELFKEQIADLQGAIQLYAPGLEEEASKGKKVPDLENKRNNYYKIILKFREDIFETGTDPLMLLLELDEKGKILENYINISNVPRLVDLESYKCYLIWTIFLETEANIDDLEDIFIFVQDDNDIFIEEITDELDFWFSDEKRTGEMLVDRGLISPEDVEEVLQRQKQIGELLVDEGKISRGQIEKVIKLQKSLRRNHGADTIRVDTHKLEGIMNNIAELLIAQAQVKELVSRVAQYDLGLYTEISNSFQEVDKTIRIIQEQVLTTSMVPIGGTFTRMKRIVRDISSEEGKEINLVIEGEETELDKKVVEELADPLKHLIRNAIDHGIEEPEKRRQLDKPPVGTIGLKAYHQEGNIIIEVSDDGQGINEEAVLQKAREKGLVGEEEKLSDYEIRQLIFRPGFSTAKKVSDISGRGVGLDVVINNIKNLRGSVEVLSNQNKGTTFKISLPLTLAIIDGMVVRVGEERYIVPLGAISEFVKAKKENIQRVEGKGLILNLRNEYIPYAPLYKFVDVQAQYREPTEGLIAVLKNGNKMLAVLIDEIIGQEQVVIKNIKENMGQAEGIAGATIMGNGKVALILDVPSIFRIYMRS